jgi:hypothetical protein
MYDSISVLKTAIRRCEPPRNFPIDPHRRARLEPLLLIPEGRLRDPEFPGLWHEKTRDLGGGACAPQSFWSSFREWKFELEGLGSPSLNRDLVRKPLRLLQKGRLPSHRSLSRHLAGKPIGKPLEKLLGELRGYAGPPSDAPKDSSLLEN